VEKIKKTLKNGETWPE